ncbi:hypothetical protein T06_11302 [Trichinella sp. T6]|nr:hypothetical protein T06_11302 [Trichinella sp. T6]
MTELNKDANNDNPTIRQHHLCVRYQRGETAQLRTWNKIEHRLSASTSGVVLIVSTVMVNYAVNKCCCENPLCQFFDE